LSLATPISLAIVLLLIILNVYSLTQFDLRTSPRQGAP
jgi:hypothetical protein